MMYQMSSKDQIQRIIRAIDTVCGLSNLIVDIDITVTPLLAVCNSIIECFFVELESNLHKLTLVIDVITNTTIAFYTSVIEDLSAHPLPASHDSCSKIRHISCEIIALTLLRSNLIKHRLSNAFLRKCCKAHLTCRMNKRRKQFLSVITLTVQNNSLCILKRNNKRSTSVSFVQTLNVHLLTLENIPSASREITVIQEHGRKLSFLHYLNHIICTVNFHLSTPPMNEYISHISVQKEYLPQ